MNKILACILCALGVFGSGLSEAQTFAPGTKAAENVKKNDTVSNFGARPSKTSATAEKTASKADDDDESLIVNTVEKKLGAETRVDENKYDNSMGKVFQFKIVNGDVVFDDERKVLVSYENYKVERGMDGIVRCSMRLYVLNDFLVSINNLGLKLKWPEISTNLNMSKINPGVKTYMDVMLLGEGCLSMDKAPTIEVNRCRVKGMSEEKCADAIRWFKKNQ